MHTRKDDLMRRLSRSVLALGAVTLLLAAPASAQKTTAPAAKKPAAKTSTVAQPAMPSGIRIDLNSATPRQLQAIPGVTAATAKKIVKGRPYAAVDDVLKAGVSKTQLEKIRPYVTVSAATSNPPTAGEKK